MITMQELLSGNKWEDVPKEHQENAKILLELMNNIRTAYGLPMIITSGYRSIPQHMRIYADKGIKELKLIPMQSAHLEFKAADVSDPDNKLKDWINNNQELMQKLNFYCEDFRSTPGWVHITYRKPNSGKRFFIP